MTPDSRDLYKRELKKLEKQMVQSDSFTSLSDWLDKLEAEAYTVGRKLVLMELLKHPESTHRHILQQNLGVAQDIVAHLEDRYAQFQRGFLGNQAGQRLRTVRQDIGRNKGVIAEAQKWITMKT